MADGKIVPDAKTQELFDLLGLTNPSVREAFVKLASVKTTIKTPDVSAHLRLDSSTSPDEPDAELA